MRSSQTFFSTLSLEMVLCGAPYHELIGYYKK
jgi:hypothetical protein